MWKKEVVYRRGVMLLLIRTLEGGCGAVLYYASKKLICVPVRITTGVCSGLRETPANGRRGRVLTSHNGWAAERNQPNDGAGCASSHTRLLCSCRLILLPLCMYNFVLNLSQPSQQSSRMIQNTNHTQTHTHAPLNRMIRIQEFVAQRNWL